MKVVHEGVLMSRNKQSFGVTSVYYYFSQTPKCRQCRSQNQSHGLLSHYQVLTNSVLSNLNIVAFRILHRMYVTQGKCVNICFLCLPNSSSVISNFPQLHFFGFNYTIDNTLCTYPFRFNPQAPSH